MGQWVMGHGSNGSTNLGWSCWARSVTGLSASAELLVYTTVASLQ